MSKTTEDILTIQVELGHRADFKPKVLAGGYTHDWTIFVRGQDGADISHFVEKVIFNLHETFKSPKRVVWDPPYEVTESGYAGFLLTIEIFFRSRPTYRKISFQYDLYLNGEGAPAVSTSRMEKLKFRNPADDFRQKLLKSGAISSAAMAASGAASSASQPFTDLFGMPIKTSLDSPKKSKHKDKDRDKSSKGKPSPSTSIPSQSQSERDYKGDNSGPSRSYVHSGKDISNSSSTPKDSSASHKDTSFSHKDKESSAAEKRDRDMDRYKESSSSAGYRDGSSHRKSSSSHKDSSRKLSSGFKDNSSSSLSKSSAPTVPSTKSSSKDSVNSSKGSSKESSHRKEGSKSGHKKSKKDKSDRDKDSSSGAVPKQTFAHTSSEDWSSKKVYPDDWSSKKTSSEEGMSKKAFEDWSSKKTSSEEGASKRSVSEEGLLKKGHLDEGAAKKKKHEGGSSSSKHHKSSRSEPVRPPSGEHPSKSSQNRESSKSSKSNKKDDSKPTTPKISEESEYKHSHSSKKEKSEKYKSEKSSSKKKSHRSSRDSSSSSVSTVSSLKFTDEEDEEMAGLKIDSLMEDLIKSEGSKERSRPKSKQGSPSHLSSSSPSPSPPRPSSHHSGSSSKTKPNKKSKKPSSPHVKSKEYAKEESASLKPKYSKKKEDKKEMKKEKTDVKKKVPPLEPVIKQKKTPHRKSPDLMPESQSMSISPQHQTPSPPQQPLEKTKKHIIAAKPTKVNIEEGEISSMSESSDSEDDGLDDKSKMINTDSNHQDGKKIQQPKSQPPASDLEQEQLNGTHSPPQQNGKLWYATDLADNGYSLGKLLKLQEKIGLIQNPDVLQHIVDLMCGAGCLKMEQGCYIFDLCSVEKDFVDEVVDIVQEELGELDLCD